MQGITPAERRHPGCPFSTNTFLDVKGIADQAAAMTADKKQLKEIPAASNVKKKYVGIYKFSSADPATINIFEQNGQLFFRGSISPTAWQMHFINEDEFLCYTVHPNTHVFSKKKNGRGRYIIIKNFKYETNVMHVK